MIVVPNLQLKNYLKCNRGNAMDREYTNNYEKSQSLYLCEHCLIYGYGYV